MNKAFVWSVIEEKKKKDHISKWQVVKNVCSNLGGEDLKYGV